MNNVTVTCGCTRKMRPDGTSVHGSFTCGCGARVVVTMIERPQCMFTSEDDVRCRAVPVRSSATFGLSLCGEHLAALAEMFAGFKYNGKSREEATAEALAAFAEGRQLRADWNAERAERDATVDWYVYYVRIGDRIKIGTTGAFQQRMYALMPDEILAVEPGGQPLEHARHLQFRHLQSRGERFHSGEDLLSHIKMIREHYPELIGALPGYAAPQPT